MPLFANKNSKKGKGNTFNPKEINRKQLQKQNLIFFVSAIIIIIALIGLIGFFINFVIKQINFVFETVSRSSINLEGFDLQGFSEIKEKLTTPKEELEEQLKELLENTTTSPQSTTTPAVTITPEITSTPTATPPQSSPTISP